MHTPRAYSVSNVDLGPDQRRRAGDRPEPASDRGDQLARDVVDLAQNANAAVADLLRDLPPHHPMLPRLESVRGTVDRMASLAGRLHAGDGVAQALRERIDLNALLGGVCALWQRLTGPFITLDVALEPRGAWIAADVGQIDQLLLHLVMRARDALPLGGTIRISTHRRLLASPRAYEHGTLPAGDWTLVEVRDSGASLDDASRAQLLEPDPVSGRETLGAASGLVAVRDAATRAGGRILVDAGPAIGTAITVWLPAVSAPRERRAMHGTPQAILIVDPDEWVRTSTSHTLRRAGYAVLEADHAATAIELLQDVAGRCVRLILIDAGVAGFDGRPFVESLRRDRPAVQLMVMLGRDGSPPVDAYLAQAGRILIKPFAAVDLLAAIRERFGGAD